MRISTKVSLLAVGSTLVHSNPFPNVTITLPDVTAVTGPLIGVQEACLTDAAITFDDGPHIYETALVDELVKSNVKATFFVNGFNYGCIYDESNVQSIRHAFESGMTIASHTWNHYDITLSGNETLGRQLDLVETALWNIIGVKPLLFRPPYGSFNAENVAFLNSRGYTVVGWSADSGDSGGATVEESIAVVNAIENGSLILAHETYQKTVEGVVPGSVPGVAARGVKLVNVDTCLGISPYQAVRGAYGVRDDTWTCDGTPVPGVDF